MEPDDTSEYDELIEELCINLGNVERRIWLKLADGRPVSEVAEDEHVERAAIYARIHRMAKKNGYVSQWWRRRHDKSP